MNDANDQEHVIELTYFALDCSVRIFIIFHNFVHILRQGPFSER